MRCEQCGDECLDKFCDFCDRLYFKNSKTNFVHTRMIKPKVKVVKAKGEGVCDKCGDVFKKRHVMSKTCGVCNKKKKERTPAEKWLDKKPYVNNANSNAVAYKFFRKQYSVPNNVYRG